MALFDDKSDVIENYFYDVRLSKVDVRHRFELTTDRPIFQKLHSVPPSYNEVIKSEVHSCWKMALLHETSHYGPHQW